MNAIRLEYTDDEIEESINELNEEVQIGNLTYQAGWALKCLDRIAFDTWGAELPDRWECSECDKVHDDEGEAEECCKPEE